MKAEPCAGAHRGDTAEAYVKAVERVIAHMKSNLEEPLDLDALAHIAVISKFHLVRVFDEITGTTPRHFLSCLRIQRAKELLLNSQDPITEICFRVGYNSLGSFSKIFNELVGLGPQEFRALPKRLNAVQFAKAVWSYLRSDRGFDGPALEGVVEGARRQPRGFTFVGAFTRGVPLGAPFSGTVLLRPGRFRLERPPVPEFHLLAAFIPLSARLTTIVTTLPVGLVASLRLQPSDAATAAPPCLRLRPLRPTDPPIVLALPALPPWRRAFSP
jgi:AraC family transcriptional regulator